MTSDFEVQAMPATFEGAIGMTMQRYAEWRDGVPEHPGDARCRELYEKATGERQPRNKGAESNSAYPVIMFACGYTQVFEAMAKAAGTELTRPRFLAALGRLGPIDTGFYLGGAFRPGKSDLTDRYRLLRYQARCRCWRTASPVRQARV